MTCPELRRSLWVGLAVVLTGCPASREQPSTREPEPDPRPIAILDVPFSGELEQPLALDGRRSTPGSARYVWRVTAPAGGRFDLRDAETAMATFRPRDLGAFQVELTVAAFDRTATATATIQVVCPEPIQPALRIFGNETFSNRSPGSCADYRLTQGLKIVGGASLTVEPGVIVEVGDDAEVTVDAAALYATADETDGIVFRGSTSRTGAWKGIRLVDALDSQLRGVVVRHGGAQGAAVRVEGASVVALESLTIEDAGGGGIWLSDRARLTSYARNTFRRAGGPPLSLPLALLGDVRATNDRHEDVAPASYEVRGGFLLRETTIDPAALPFTLTGTSSTDRIVFAGALNVRPGVVLEIADGLGVEFAFGTTDFLGSADALIEIRGAAGRWAGLLVARGATVRLDHVRISGGGMDGRPYAPAPEPASLTVTGTPAVTRASLNHVEIVDHPGVALWIEPTGTEVSCESVATSGQVVPSCPLP